MYHLMQFLTRGQGHLPQKENPSVFTAPRTHKPHASSARIRYQPGFQAFKAEKFILHLSLHDLTRARL
jgi:hypothetical protein